MENQAFYQHPGWPLPDGAATWLPLVAEDLFAAQVRQRRESLGWTQARLARALSTRGVSMSQSAIAKIERADSTNRRPIRLVEAAAIASLFETTIDSMLEILPQDDEHAELMAAMERRSQALGDLQAARQALAAAEAAADDAEEHERRLLEAARQKKGGD